MGLSCNFSFWWCLWLVLVPEWWWLHRMILGVFPLLQSLKEFEKDWHKFLVYLGEFPSEATRSWTFICREFFFFFFWSVVLLIYSVVSITAIQQSDSVILIYAFFFIFFSIVVYHRILNIVPMGSCFNYKFYFTSSDWSVQMLCFSWLSFGRLYVSKNLSISSRLSRWVCIRGSGLRL